MKKIKKADTFLLRPNLYDYLKVLAILTMIIDHVGYYLFPQMIVLRLIGRIAFPIFLFLVGFNGSYKRRWNLLFMAIFVQGLTIFLWIMTGFGKDFLYLNILFSILISRTVLSFLAKMQRKFWSILAFSLLIVGGVSTETGFFLIKLFNQYLDYGILGLLFAISGFFAQQRKGAGIGFLLFCRLLFFYFFNLAASNFRFSGTLMSILQGEMRIMMLLIALLTVEKWGMLPFSLRTNTILDQLFLFISQNALWIYGGHILVLIVLFLLKNQNLI